RQLDPAAPTGRDRRRSRPLHAPARAEARTGDAAPVPRRGGASGAHGIPGRRHIPQRALSVVRPERHAARGRARPPSGRPRRPPRAAGRTPRHALRPGSRPALAPLGGDRRALAGDEEFGVAEDALAPLGDRLVCIAGNHDRYPLALQPNRLYEEYFPPRPLPDGFAALDSCGAVCWPVITQGRIVDAQLRQDFSGKIVLVHHAPFRSGGVPDWPWHRLRGAQKLLEAAREAAAILCGHIHERFQHGNVICAGSSTLRGDEGYWLIELAGGRVAKAT